MIIEPEKYFQSTIPRLHTLWNGKDRDFSHHIRQNSNVSLLELSRAGRWYANGFISAYNFCEQYEKEHPSAKVDFAFYADNLEQTNETNSTSDNDLNRNYIVNIGRIEGVRFYLKEQGSSDIKMIPNHHQVHK